MSSDKLHTISLFVNNQGIAMKCLFLSTWFNIESLVVSSAFDGGLQMTVPASADVIGIKL